MFLLKYLPEKFKEQIRDRVAFFLSKHLCSFNISHSSGGEDIILASFLQALKIPLWSINYIEIGTHHPLKANNTFLLYRNGARGVCVEPNPALSSLIKKYRPDDELVTAGITNKRSHKDIYYDYGDKANAWNTFDKKEVERRNLNGFPPPQREIEIPMININDFLSKYDRVPDLLAIDVEGLDYDLIATVDYERYPVPLILVETIQADTDVALTKDMRIVEYLSNKGYIMLADTWSNMIFYNQKWCTEKLSGC